MKRFKCSDHTVAAKNDSPDKAMTRPTGFFIFWKIRQLETINEAILPSYSNVQHNKRFFIMEEKNFKRYADLIYNAYFCVLNHNLQLTYFIIMKFTNINITRVWNQINWSTISIVDEFSTTTGHFLCDVICQSKPSSNQKCSHIW